LKAVARRGELREQRVVTAGGSSLLSQCCPAIRNLALILQPTNLVLSRGFDVFFLNLGVFVDSSKMRETAENRTANTNSFEI